MKRINVNSSEVPSREHNKQESLLDIALNLLKQGLKPFPLARFFNWRQYVNATLDEKQIKEAFNNYPATSLGVVLSKGQVVLRILDVDLADQVSKLPICQNTLCYTCVSQAAPKGGIIIWLNETEANNSYEHFKNVGYNAEIVTCGSYVPYPPYKGFEFICQNKVMSVGNARTIALEILSDTNEAAA